MRAPLSFRTTPRAMWAGTVSDSYSICTSCPSDNADHAPHSAMPMVQCVFQIVDCHLVPCGQLIGPHVIIRRTSAQEVERAQTVTLSIGKQHPHDCALE